MSLPPDSVASGGIPRAESNTSDALMSSSTRAPTEGDSLVPPLDLRRMSNNNDYGSVDDTGKIKSQLQSRSLTSVNPDSETARRAASGKQKLILMVALFLKGGLLGAYGPFIALWLHLKRWGAAEVGVLSACDILFSLLLVPLYGLFLDKYKCHNIGLSVTMWTAGVLKLCYLLVQTSFWGILFLTALTAPLLKGANSVLDGQVLYAFKDKADFCPLRYFGSLGFGILALITGLIVSGGAHGMSSFGIADEEEDLGAAGAAAARNARYQNVDYVFYVFATVCFFSGLYWWVAHRYVAGIRKDGPAEGREEFSQFTAKVKKAFGILNQQEGFVR